MISGNEQFERDFEAFLKGDDSRLAALYRKLPQAEPDAKLDAAVMAMAHRTLNPHLVATPLATSVSRRRTRWLAPLGAAAGLVLAAGVALRLGPQVWNEHAATPASIRDNGVIEVRPIDEAPAPPASPPPPPAEAPAPTASAPAMSMQAARPMKPKAEPAPAAREATAEEAQQQAATAAPAITADRAEIDTKVLKKVENAASSPAQPQAFPGSGRRESEMDAVERKQAIATGAWQKLHENQAAGGAPAGMVTPKSAVTRNAPAPAAAALGATATPPPAARAKSTAPQAASAESTVAPADTAAAPPEQEKFSQTRQAPNSAELIHNSRLYPESWIAAIQRLLHEGHRDEALQNLELFHRKYPNYRLPADLKQLSASQR